MLIIPSYVDFDLRLLPSLRYLSLAQTQLCGPEFLGARLVGFLAHIRTLVNLEELRIGVPAYTEWPHGIDWSVWSCLDDLLTASELQHFRRFTLDMWLWVDHDVVCVEPQVPVAKSEPARLRAAMPKLASRGLLQVHLIPR